WNIVSQMAAGSIPAAIITSLLLSYFFTDASGYSHILTIALGIMLLLTSCVVFFRQKIRKNILSSKHRASSRRMSTPVITCIIGVLIGVFVTLSSVGAGAIGTAVLLCLYPHLVSQRIVGTDIAHAVPLTFIAGLAHLWLGNVDFVLLACLLVGSLPAIHLGTAISNHLPSRVLQPILASILFGLGLKLVFF
ncbi:MAG: sulfite exporter TauE/SafE family protein, partial [Cellvibrionaceae bacterium]|nr:sulfite exporter TauE/SafE family protein [Cellvibrionaceae bacterium]